MEETSKKKNNSHIIVTLLLVLGLLSITIGVSVAFFNYTRTGSANVLAVGRIYFSSSQGTAINLTNVFPVNRADIENNSNVSSVTLTITGDTTNTQGIEYQISADNVINTVNSKEIPIGINVTVADLGTPDASYFDNRGGNTSIYKILAKDTINSDDQLVVGYITSGATGVSGSVTVQAFIDGDKIAISDTYDGTESGSMGTTNEWVNDRTILTTTEWNSLNSNGVSFKLKVEANEGIWVKEPLTAVGQIIKEVNTTTQINFGNISSDTNGKGLYILPGTESDVNPIYYYRGAVTNNNVIFGGFCWQIVRTTNTGGIKMIYNGVATGDGKTCENTTGASRQLATTSAFNTNYQSVSDVGYMYNQRYAYDSSGWTTNALFGSTATWVTDHYELTDASVTTPDTTHHYSCNATTSDATCTSLRYVYYVNGTTKYYITLTNGDTIEDALYKMTGTGSTTTKAKNASYVLNRTDSKAKTEIENWFKTNLTNEEDASKTNYQEYLEDTIYCNDRSYKETGSSDTYNQSGWNPNGGSLSTYLYFGTWNRFNYSNWYSTINIPSMECENVTDRFSVSNQEAKLKYPVGLLTADEIILAGAAGNSTTSNTSYYLYTGNYYWSLSPYYFYSDSAYGFNVDGYGYLYYNYVYRAYGLRPVVSLKLGTEFEDGGEGTILKPYVVKYN